MKLLTAEQLGKVLQIHPGAVRRFARDGKIPAYKYGRAWRFDINEVKAVLRCNSEVSLLPGNRATPPVDRATGSPQCHLLLPAWEESLISDHESRRLLG